MGAVSNIIIGRKNRRFRFNGQNLGNRKRIILDTTLLNQITANRNRSLINELKYLFNMSVIMLGSVIGFGGAVCRWSWDLRIPFSSLLRKCFPHEERLSGDVAGVSPSTPWPLGGSESLWLDRDQPFSASWAKLRRSAERFRRGKWSERWAETPTIGWPGQA